MQVSEVFRSGSSSFVGYKHLASEKRDRTLANRMHDPFLPSDTKRVNARNARQHIDAVRRQSYLDNRFGLGKIRGNNFHTFERCAKTRQRLPNSLGIGGRWFDPDIQILSATRNSMYRHGVSANHKELDFRI